MVDGVAERYQGAVMGNGKTATRTRGINYWNQQVIFRRFRFDLYWAWYESRYYEMLNGCCQCTIS